MKRRSALLLAATGLAGCIIPTRSRGGYVDAHSHIWTTDIKRFPLRKGILVADLKPHSFTAEDLIKLGHTENVTRHVLISHGPYHGFNNDYYTHAVSNHPGIFSVVGAMNPSLDHIPARMRANRKLRITGYRIKPNGDAHWLQSKPMHAMWKTGATENIAMCPLIDPKYITGLNSMCRRFPDTTVVIDHCARIDSHQKEELNQLCELSKHPNVYVKISAFYAFGTRKPPYLEQIPKIMRLFESFGPRKLMWASDCPYQLENGNTYSASISLVRDHLDFLSDTDKDWLLRRTAEKVFFS
jgi:predicted TIM-barrel fold metal-dependent hydrolase